MTGTDDTRSPETELEQQSKQEASKEAAKAEVRRAARPHVTLKRQIRPQEMFALAGGFGLLALLLAEIILYSSGTSSYAIINPVFPLGGLIWFLYPFRKEIVARRTMQLGIIAFAVWLVISLSGVLFPFIVAFLVAYLFSPLVKKLDERGVPRVVTSLSIVLTILGVYAIVGFVLIPIVLRQFDDLLTSAKGLLQGANTLFDPTKLARELTRLGVPPNQARSIVVEQIHPQLQQVVAWVFSWFGEFLKNVTQVLEGLFNLILIPFLTLYLTIDFRRIRTFVKTTLLQDDPGYVYLITRVDTILSAYLRGIMITSSMVGVVAAAFLSIMGVPYALVIGIMTGVLNLIPTVGMFLNLGLAMLVYLFAPGDFWWHTLLTAGMIFTLHAVNSNLVEPRIIGDRVGLHPVMVIASLFVFGHFLGFVGLLIAVPATAVLLMFLKEWYNQAVSLKEPVYTNHAT